MEKHASWRMAMYKTRMRKTLMILVVLIILALPTGGRGKELVILHTNDLHGQSLARIATMVEDQRAFYPDLLLMDAGDLFSGTPISSAFKGEVEQKAVLALSCDAIALGNHDFDFGLDRLESSRNAGVPWLAANVLEEDGATLVKPFLIKEVGDVRVLIVGLTTTATPRMSFPKNVQGLTFADPVSTLQRILTQQHGAYDICIVLSHLGYGDDLLLAQRVPEIAAIIGGHSHTILKRPVRIGKTLITQTGTSGQYLGKIVIDLVDGVARGELLEVHESITPHPAVKAIDDAYGAALAVEMEREIGFTSRGYTKNGMGLLLNRALLDFSGADAALYNAGGVRQGLTRGSVTRGDVFAVEPFGNEAVLVTLSGPVFAKLLEITSRRSSDFYDGPKLIDLDRSYSVVTSDFLASEGSNYPMLAQGEILHLGSSVREVLEDYLRDQVLEPLQKEGAL